MSFSRGVYSTHWLYSLLLSQSNAIFEITASEPLGGGRAVTWDGYLLTSSNQDDYAGITEMAVSTGEEVRVFRVGEYTDATLSLTADQPVFAHSSGVITQSFPSLPIRRLGMATSATTINLDPFPVIGA